LSETAGLISDEQLAKARFGEATALNALVQAHQRLVYSLALRMLGTRDLAEDLTQDVFMQLNRSFKSIASADHLVFWLRKATTHRAIDQLRRRSLLEITSLEDEEPLFSEEEGRDPLLQTHLKSLLAELTPPARAVVLLRYQEDLDPLDIARTLDMPINTVKSHLKRSLESMRQKSLDAAQPRCEDGST
jgi:RNA polymerase sigma-70 factor, ECF subfamily